MASSKCGKGAVCWDKERALVHRDPGQSFAVTIPVVVTDGDDGFHFGRRAGPGC
jgi:hypothetical protein